MRLYIKRGNDKHNKHDRRRHTLVRKVFGKVNISKHVLDFEAVKEAEPSNDFVGDATLCKG